MPSRFTRKHIVVTTCYISSAMRVRKVLDSKSDLQGHSMSLAMVPFDRPHTISYLSSIATMSLTCTISEILSVISQNLKRSRDAKHISLERHLSRVYSSVSISIPNLKWPALPIPNIQLGPKFVKWVTQCFGHTHSLALRKRLKRSRCRLGD